MLGGKYHNKYWKTKESIYYLLKRIVAIFLSIALFIAPGYAVVSVETLLTIQGSSPRFIEKIEQEIEAEKNFKYFGVTFNDDAYFSSDSLSLAFEQSGINIETQTPNNINLTPALGTPSREDVIELDGDEIAPLESALPDQVTLNWYYENITTGAQLPLTTTYMRTTFANLKRSSIYPYVKVKGPVLLKTDYGDPLSQSYPDRLLSLTKEPVRDFFIPLGARSIQYASPNMKYVTGNYSYDNNTEIFDPQNSNGFVPQSSYLDNFPTTGANGLYFYLVTEGIPNPLSTTKWDVKSSSSSITAKVIKDKVPGTTNGFKTYDAKNMVLVMLSGPAATSNADKTTADDVVLPVDIEVIGSDTMGNDVSYKFRIRQWFIGRGGTTASRAEQLAWCEALSPTKFYHLITKTDFTNGLSEKNPNQAFAKRTNKEGFLTEWGRLGSYGGDATFASGNAWTNTEIPNSNREYYYVTNVQDGNLYENYADSRAMNGICASQRTSD